MKLFKVVSVVSLLFLAQSTSAAVISCEPDTFAVGTVLTNACTGVELSVEQRTDTTYSIIPAVTTATSTGDQVFGHGTDGYGWGASDANPETLRGDFDNFVDFVSIDLISNDFSDGGFLRIYDSFDNLLDEVFSGTMSINTIFTASFSRLTADIAYFRASGISGDNLNLDNLQYSASVPTPATVLLMGLGLAGVVATRRRKKA